MSMSDVNDALTYVFTWRTYHDAKVCPKCNSLDGHVIFYDLFAPVLVSDAHGPVWDLDRDQSLAHGYHKYHCRCTLDVDVDVDWGKISEFQELQEPLNKFGVYLTWIKERFKLSSNIQQARQDVQEFKAEIRELEREVRLYRNLLMDSTVLASQLGIKGASDIRQTITLLYQLKAAYDAVQLARMAAGDPLAWLGAGITVASAAVSLGSTFIREDVGSEGPQ